MALALVGSAPPQDSARAVALVQPSHGIALLPAPDARHQSACPVSRKKAARRRRHSNGLLVHALTVGLRWRQRQHLRRGSSGVDEDAGGDATAYALDGRSCRPRFSSSSTRPTRSSDRRRLSQLRSRNSTWHSNPCACPPSPDHSPPLQRGRVASASTSAKPPEVLPAEQLGGARVLRTQLQRVPRRGDDADAHADAQVQSGRSYMVII